jgi:glycosyltransferase involved in cell wall biosynthesis
MQWIWLVLFAFSLYSASIADKVLICGIARNVEKAVPNVIQSANQLGLHFSDYRVIIYENNSSDRTKKLFSKWAKNEPRVIFISEYLNKKKLEKEMSMGVLNRTEQIARARNIVLDEAMKEKYDDYKYIIWADLDFVEPWDVEHMVETIVQPEQEWDAVFAYGAYDLFPLRTAEWPIGFELLGQYYWEHLDEVRHQFVFSENAGWKKVYSAFGGFGIYKRDAVKGCRYSGVVTDDLETLTEKWLKEAKDVPYLKKYQELLSSANVVVLAGKALAHREDYPAELGLRFAGKTVTWFSCTPKTTLPWTCEHLTLHASMILKGHGRLFINPKISCGYQ